MPRNQLQNAPSAEHLAFLLGAFRNESGTDAFSDCKSVIQTWKRGRKFTADHRLPCGGVWRLWQHP